MPATIRKLGLAGSLIAVLAMTGCDVIQPEPEIAIVQTPAPDGTSCYTGARVPFYQVVQTVLQVDRQQAETRRNGQIAAGLGVASIVAGALTGGTAGKVLIGVGALATVVGAFAATVQTDQRYIADLSTSYGGLVRCRQDEARRIRLAVRARRTRVDDGRVQLQNLHELMEADAQIAHEANDSLARRNRTYLLASDDIDTKLASDPVERQQQAPQVMRTRQTIQSNQRATTEFASAIDKSAQTITVSSLERHRMFA